MPKILSLIQMPMKNGEMSKDLLLSQAHIWNHIFSFINSMSLKCAIELQIPDVINRHGSPMPLSELVGALSINKERSHFVYRLMRILVHSGFLVEEEEGYLVAHASRLLLRDEPLSIRPLLLAVLDPILMDPWQQLSEWFKNDDVTPFETTHGRTFWDYASQEPKLNHLFNEAMACDARLVTSIVLKEYGQAFKGLRSIVDVGGGIGTVAKSIAQVFPDLSCLCFDLPHVVDGLVGSKNLSYVGGNMFKVIPKADAILLKWILHNWNDEECIKILKQCKEAIPNKENGGKLIIIDMVLKNNNRDDESYKTQLYYDMLMMTFLTGRERTEKEWAKLLLDDAGLSDYKVTPILGVRSLIEVYH